MMRNQDYAVFGIIAVILLSGCLGDRNDEEAAPETTLTTIPTTTTELCGLSQDECDTHCESMCGPDEVDYCLFDEEGCNCKYECGVETTSTSTTTIGHVTCDVYCRGIEKYESGICRINSGECRSRGVKEIYVPRGNKYCPKNRPESSCCCRLE
ncbi:MAG: hypothetical protein L6243_03970 [Candidatus Altiarchaeales archaeon]|nr:hypothetical protein [Candidatus Altiarchaeota archaeon]MBU4266123.1 hypothetical protein [Candidatus Altiarchaeota archaeon]MBU4341111.1 hypothetical protein [Candidatus Altiarchaeota archaeon]MCG2782727.1 hypothetical protein [Candidatus Altiarchaeales archaeon]